MKIIKYSGFLFIFFTLLVSFNMWRFKYGFNDGFWRTLMIPFEGTIWAPGFSEKGFSQIQLKMSEKEVAVLLGEPLRKNCGTENCFWVYSWQDTETADFDQRSVIFDLNGVVTEIRKSFFID